MKAPDPNAWAATNLAQLHDAVTALRERLQDEHAAPLQERNAQATTRDAARSTLALDILCESFNLSPFERDIVLLCAAPELDVAFAGELSRHALATPDGRPTFALALKHLGDGHFSALSPTSPLRRWRLIELAPAAQLVSAGLRLDERVLHYLAGVNGADERLLGLLHPVPLQALRLESRREVALQIARYIKSVPATASFPVIELTAHDSVAAQDVAANALAACAVGAARLDAHDVPTTATERDTLSVLVQREAALAHTGLLLNVDPQMYANRAHSVDAFVGALEMPLIVLTTEPLPLRTARPVLRVSLPPLAQSEQRDVWEMELGDALNAVNSELGPVLQQFRLDEREIAAGAVQVSSALASADAEPGLLWRVCRGQARTQLSDLGTRIKPHATWSQLVLPDAQTRVLHDIALHMRQRERVYATWGFEQQCSRGLGISALFAGPSGTGKTMAAEVLANELQLDLYRIDLSQVVSKYIGETEKNLRRVFDAAQNAGAILLFDEADALFGKRSEVRDSHDRYANIEVSYLLQRMEAYRGIAILTSNMKDALDQAFLRRIRFVVNFPFPDTAERARIWQSIFPAQTPTSGLDAQHLAQLRVAGGHIRNIAMNAAFLAADRDAPVVHADVLRAAQDEYSKLDKTLSERESRGLL